MVDKLAVLGEIAEIFWENNVTWAVGGSTMLYLKNIVSNFDDLDIMVAENDAQKVKKLLCQIGEMKNSEKSGQYKSKFFGEFCVKGVDLDIIAGFVIVVDGVENYFPLQKQDITENFVLNGVKIPLHSVQVWRKYYDLMGRHQKVEIIDESSLKS